ncbi:MAG: hypothetical protein H0X71_01730 [Rubrobacter sp.]|nr:hypothetical protein [Rubrobacter sp.]
MGEVKIPEEVSEATWAWRGHLQQLRILTLTSRTVSGNTAEFGGGIFALNESPDYITMESSPISSNTVSAAGGEILNCGVTGIQYSTITEKTATRQRSSSGSKQTPSSPARIARTETGSNAPTPPATNNQKL